MDDFISLKAPKIAFSMWGYLWCYWHGFGG